MTRLKELRKTLGYTQAEFAEKIAMAQQGVSMAENGTRPLTDRQIVTICAVFGVSESWLRTGDGDMFPPPAEEDSDLIDILGDLAAEDIPPRKKRLMVAIARTVRDLPEGSLDALSDILSTLADSLKTENAEE